jgi:uncharacterized RDD family membrane protein YckC
MTGDGDFSGEASRPPFPQGETHVPYIPAPALDGVRTRRILAVMLDLILVSGLSVALFFGLLILSFGMSLILLPPIFPIVAFFYNGLTVSGPRMATPGMSFMDLEIRTMQGEPVAFLQAAVHAVLFYVSWMLPPIFLVSLVTSDKRCLHDIVADVVVIRRSA